MCVATARGTGALSEPRGGRVPVIRGFDLGFTDRQRPVRRVELGVVGDSFRFSLEDRDGEEEIAGRLEFYDWGPQLESFRARYGLPEGSAYATLQTVSASGCRGECTLEVPRPSEGWGSWDGGAFLVLTGFSFAYQGERARVLRELAVWPNGDGGIETVFGNSGGHHPYDVEVSYAILPRARIADPDPTRPERFRTVTSSNTVVASPHDPPADRGGGTVAVEDPDDGWLRLRYLAGFRARYRNDDYRLKRFAIDLHQRPVSLYLQGNDAAKRVVFSVLWHEAQTQFN